MDRLQSMQAFVRVVDAGSFTEAARRWGRSKAAVSKYIGQLEEHLGVRLLQRTTRAMRLTPAGRAYEEQCRRLLDELDVLEASIRDAAAVSPRGLLRVTAPHGFGQLHLDAMVVRFQQTHPDVEIELTLLDRFVDLVAEGFDVAIRLTEPTDSALMAKRLAPCPMVVCASPAYLADAGIPTHPDELTDHACLVDTNFRARNRWTFTQGDDTFEIDVQGPARVNSPLALRKLALADLGILLCPRFVVAADLDVGALVPLLEDFESFPWGIWALYPHRRHLSPRVRAFIDHMAAELSSADQPL